MDMENNLQDLKKKFNDIERNLENPTNLSQKEFITLSKEYSELRPIIKIIDEYSTLKEEISDLEEIMKDENSEGDIKELAKEEFFEKHKVLLPKIKAKLKLALLPKDEDDSRNAILEIKGTASSAVSFIRAFIMAIFIGLTSYIYNGQTISVAVLVLSAIVLELVFTVYLLRLKDPM